MTLPFGHFQIGRYDIQHLLGRGAMGMVYLAHDPLLKRDVAVKIVTGTEEDRAVMLQRFKCEAEISAKLSHPNIVTVFDVGEDSRVGPYLAMEYVDGFLLSRLAQDGLGQLQTLRLLIQAAGALKAAGDLGIVHRDVKPENMMVDRHGRLRLMDFGIARQDNVKRTHAGMLLGTPSYTAPELLQGASPSPVTDRYAFAVTAFELLFEISPFRGENLSATLYAVAHESPLKPTAMPPNVYNVFLKALAKTPEDRYPTLDSFLHALIHALPLDKILQEKLHSFVEEDAGPLKYALREHFAQATTDKMDLKEVGQWWPPHKQSATFDAPPLSYQNVIIPLGAIAFLAIGYWSYTLIRPQTAHIATTPPDARLFVNGVYHGRSPLTYTLRRNEECLVRAEQEGYQPLVRKLQPKECGLHLILQKSPFYVTVQTQPSAAQVWLDDKMVGATPLPSLPVPAEGKHVLVIKKAGYEKFEMTLHARHAMPEMIHLTKTR